MQFDKTALEPEALDRLPSGPRKEFFLIGDSHSVAIWRAARELGMNVRGGPLSAGHRLHYQFFRIENDQFILLVGGDPDHKKINSFKDMLVFDGAILSTVGFNTHRFVTSAVEYQRTTDFLWKNVSSAVFAQCVREERKGALEFYEAMANYSRKVFFATSPQRFSDLEEKEIWYRFDSTLIAAVAGTGAKFVDVRAETCDAQGKLLPEFAKVGDDFHGSVEWGKQVLAKFSQLAWGSPPPVVPSEL